MGIDVNSTVSFTLLWVQPWPGLQAYWRIYYNTINPLIVVPGLKAFIAAVLRYRYSRSHDSGYFIGA